MVEAHQEITELDLNPVIASPDGVWLSTRGFGWRPPRRGVLAEGLVVPLSVSV